jgi:hypothetical protein
LYFEDSTVGRYCFETGIQLKTLRNLARLEEGQTAFINPAAAEELCRIGLAEPFGIGEYHITQKGKVSLLETER